MDRYDARTLIATAHTDVGEGLAAIAVEVVERNSSVAVRDIARFIIRESATMIRQGADGADSAALDPLVGLDDGTTATLDEVAPPIRAAARALAAAVNGQYDSSDAHLDTALASSTDFEIAAVLALVASWFVQLKTRLRPRSAAFEV